MKVLAFTSIRSEYDLMSSLYLRLNSDSEVTFKLLVGGAHNSPTFGLTVNDIRSDGFDIIQVESLLDSDTSASRLKSASLLLMSSIDLVLNFSPDLILYAGDREEVLIGGLLAGYLGVPSIHFFGGDHACDGHIDNPIRHATSKLSTCHFVSTEEHKKRLIALGEPEFRIHNIGSVALDKFSEVAENPEILKTVANKIIKKKVALFIFHPVEEEMAITPEIISDTIQSLIDEGFHVFVGMPNSDHGNSIIRSTIKKVACFPDVTIYGNLPRIEFVQLFKACNLIIGNSSAGLLEAASIPIPCINIGIRQKGRYCGKNVQFSGSEKIAVLKSIKTAISDDYLNAIKNMSNPYGDGGASKRAYDLIKKLNLQEIKKKKEDALDDYDK